MRSFKRQFQHPISLLEISAAQHCWNNVFISALLLFLMTVLDHRLLQKDLKNTNISQIK